MVCDQASSKHRGIWFRHVAGSQGRLPVKRVRNRWKPRDRQGKRPLRHKRTGERLARAEALTSHIIRQRTPLCPRAGRARVAAPKASVANAKAAPRSAPLLVGASSASLQPMRATTRKTSASVPRRHRVASTPRRSTQGLAPLRTQKRSPPSCSPWLPRIPRGTLPRCGCSSTSR